MSNQISRRTFAKTAGAMALGSVLAAGAGTAHAGEFTGKIKKAVKYGMIRHDGSALDKFKLLKELGFDGVEPTFGDKTDPNELRDASQETGIPIHGVVLGSVNGIDKAIDRAKFFGSNSVLLVAGRVEADIPYDKNYKDTQAIIADAVTYAAEQKILLLVENVWNNFLISPMEMARYIDELDSEWVGVYFDVGNCCRYGWAEHWIPVLGNRIHKLDIKEYSRKKQLDEGLWKGFNVEIGEGSTDWARVREELAKINYTGWATAEVPGGGRERLAEIAKRMDDVLSL